MTAKQRNLRRSRWATVRSFALYVCLVPLIVAFAGCKGGGTPRDDIVLVEPPESHQPAPPPVPETYDDYWRNNDPYNEGVAVAYADRKTVLAKWWSQFGHSFWGEAEEMGTVATCDGVKYVWLEGYTGPTGTYPISNIKQIVTYPDGRVVDITDACSHRMGAPYVPFEFPFAGTIRVQQWGLIWNSTTDWNNRTPGTTRVFYWESTFEFGREMENPCWQGEGPQTRKVVVQKEVWWDTYLGWTRGRADGIPFSETGEPIEPNATLTWELVVGKDAGIFWRAWDRSNPDDQGYCLQSIKDTK